jgi:hypothetical protein
MLVENFTVSLGEPPGSAPQAAGLLQVVFPNFK